MKTRYPAVSIILAFVALFGAAFSCNFGGTEKKTNIFNHYYSIEPKSLLDKLEAGNANIFSPIAEEPPFISPDQQIPVPWMQEDYLRIANALNEFVWGETLDGWQLNSMNFELECTEVGIGLQDGNFRFF